MLRIGKNPKDSDEVEVSAEKQGELAERIETDTAVAASYSETKGLVDPSGMPLRTSGAKYIAADERARVSGSEYYAQSSVASEEEILVSLPLKEFERLSVKTSEVLAEAALAQQRIGKDWEEIEQLKTETRAILAQLRAA